MSRVEPTPAEVAATLPGDELVPRADVVMDRAMTLGAPPEAVWPWLAQLGKRRAGWYLSRRVERWLPRSRRATRQLHEQWTTPRAGDVVPDWGGRDATFTAARVEPGRVLVQTSTRGRIELSWALALTPVAGDRTRLHLRLRMAGVRRRRLAALVGGGFDHLTVALLRPGLEERLEVRGASS